MSLSPDNRPPRAVTASLDALRTDLADLAYDLERQGRVDAADVVMQIDARIRAMTAELAAAATVTALSP